MRKSYGRALILIILNLVIVLPFASCQNSEPEQEIIGDSETSLSNINVITDLEEIIESEDGSGAPEALLFNVEIENAESTGSDVIGVKFVYDATISTGETTYIREDPQDVNSAFVSDENGPILYDVVSHQTDLLEDWGPIEENVRQFYVILPDNTYSLIFHVELEIPTGEQELVLSDVPKIEFDSILQQGGLIQELPE